MGSTSCGRTVHGCSHPPRSLSDGWSIPPCAGRTWPSPADPHRPTRPARLRAATPHTPAPPPPTQHCPHADPPRQPGHPNALSRPGLHRSPTRAPCRRAHSRIGACRRRWTTQAPGWLSPVVDRLEKRGWVLSTPDPADGRYTLAISPVRAGSRSSTPHQHTSMRSAPSKPRARTVGATARLPSGRSVEIGRLSRGVEPLEAAVRWHESSGRREARR
jgi:hypothetical protein